MTVRIRRLAVIGALAAIAAGTAGCAGSPEDGASAGVQKITVGLPVPATTLAPVYVAEEKGMFEDAGLDVDLVTFEGDADLVKAVLGGTVDVAVGSLSGVITAVNAGQEASVFYAGFNEPGFSFYATDEVDTFEDSIGTNWGVTTFGSSTDLLTRYAISEAGLDPDNDVTIVQAGNGAARFAAMEAGSLDVNILSDPFALEAEDKGYHKILDLRDVVEDYPMHVVWGSKKFVDANTATAKKVTEAIAEGMQFTLDEPEEAGKITSGVTKIDESYATKSMSMLDDYLFPDGRMVSEAGLDSFFDMSISGGLFDERPDESEWLDTEFLPEI